MKQNSSQAIISAGNDSKIADLEKTMEQKNQQIVQLTQNSEQAIQKIENLNLINTVLISVLVLIVCIPLVVRFIKMASSVGKP